MILIKIYVIANFLRRDLPWWTGNQFNKQGGFFLRKITEKGN